MTEPTLEISIVVDGYHPKYGEVTIKGGTWTVKALKNFLDIDPAKVLAKIKPMGIQDLPDNGIITIGDGDRFMTHARSGSAA